MKKILVIVALVVLVLVTIPPKFIGNNFTTSMESVVDSIEQSPGYNAKLVSVESGWFSSQAVINIGIDMPDLAEMDLSTNVLVEGFHGPLILKDGFALGLIKIIASPSAETELPKTLMIKGDSPLYKFDAFTSLTQKTDYNVEMPMFAYTHVENDQKITAQRR